jgi:lipoate-protein ligase A
MMRDGITFHGEYKVPGGKLVVVDCAVQDARIAAIEVTGDFFLHPDDALDAITASLIGLPQTATEAETAARIRAATGPEVTFLGFSPEAIATALKRAMSDGQ